jgi:Cu+-exporting ATPase
MALEPEVAAGNVGPSPELAEMSRRLWVGVAFSIPLLAFEMGEHLPGLAFHPWLSPRVSNWMQLALATPVVLIAGWPFFVRGWASVVARSLNMFTLIAMGVGVAYAYSVVATLAPGIFPRAFRDATGAVAVYFEAAAIITALVLLGQVLELRARERTSGAIRALLELAPKTARRIRDDGEDEEVAFDEIQVGDRLRVRPGEKVAVDGKILLCAGRGRDRHHCFHRLVSVGTRARNGLWTCRGRDGAHHCLPLRAWLGHTNVDHGRSRSRRAGRRAD